MGWVFMDVPPPAARFDQSQRRIPTTHHEQHDFFLAGQHPAGTTTLLSPFLCIFCSAKCVHQLFGLGGGLCLSLFMGSAGMRTWHISRGGPPSAGFLKSGLSPSCLCPPP